MTKHRDKRIREILRASNIHTADIENAQTSELIERRKILIYEIITLKKENNYSDLKDCIKKALKSERKRISKELKRRKK
jgi:hypothetical protein